MNIFFLFYQSVISFLAPYYQSYIFNGTVKDYTDQSNEYIKVVYQKIGGDKKNDKMLLQELLDRRIRFEPDELYFLGKKLVEIAVQLHKIEKISINLLNPQNICFDEKDQRYIMFIYPLVLPSQQKFTFDKEKTILDIYLQSIKQILIQFREQQKFSQEDNTQKLDKFMEELNRQDNNIYDLKQSIPQLLDDKINDILGKIMDSKDKQIEKYLSDHIQQNHNYEELKRVETQQFFEQQQYGRKSQNNQESYVIYENLNQNLNDDGDINGDNSNQDPFNEDLEWKIDRLLKDIKEQFKHISEQELQILLDSDANKDKPNIKIIQNIFNIENKKQIEGMLELRFENKKIFYQEFFNLLIIKHLFKYHSCRVNNENQVQGIGDSINNVNIKIIRRKFDCIFYLIIQTILIYKSDRYLSKNVFDEGLKFILYKLVIQFEKIWKKEENKGQSSMLDAEMYFQYYQYSEFREILSIVGGFLENNDIELDKFIEKDLVDSIIKEQQSYKKIQYSKRNKPLEYTIFIQERVYNFMKDTLSDKLNITYNFNI